MKLEIQKKTLLAELAAAVSVCEKKNTIPVLSFVLLSADADGLQITATDLDVALRTRVKADVKEQGSICAPAKKLMELVKSLADGELELTGNDGILLVKQDKSKSKLTGLSADNFPEIVESHEQWILTPVSPFRRMLEFVTPAITTEESRYALNGARFIIGNSRMEMVATDGHRLNRCVTKDGLLPDDLALDVLIPKKTLGVLAKLIEGLDTIEISKDDNHIYFRAGQRELNSRLINGQFPNYAQVLPDPATRDVVADVDSTLAQASLRRVQLMADEKSHSVKFTFQPGEQGGVKMTAQAADVGEAEDVLPLEYRSGKAPNSELVIGFNAQYVLDALALTDGKVTFWLKDGNSQILITPTTQSDVDCQNVVMPIRL